MHDAAAATEVVYYASRKLVANAIHCKQQTTGPMGMLRSLYRYLCCIVVVRVFVSVGNIQEWVQDKRNVSDESWNTRNNQFLWFLTLNGGERGARPS